MEPVPLGSAALLLLALLAQAGAPVPVRVDFDAPPGCADGELFFRGVLARTSHVRRARPGETATRLTVRLARAAGRVRGELRMSPSGGGPAETRRVDGASCAEVVQVLSLTAALALDPMAGPPVAAPPEGPPPEVPPSPPPSAPIATSPAAAGPTAPSSAATNTPPAPPAVTPPPEPPPVELPRPPPPVAAPPAQIETASPPPATPVTGGMISVAAIGSQVLASSFSLGVSLSGRYVVETQGGMTPSIALAFRYLAGDFFHGGDDLGIRYAALSATGCPGWALRHTIVVEPCARVTAGLLGATDHAVTNPRSVDRWWESAGALLHGALRVGGRLTLELEVGLDVPFVTRRFVTTTPPQAVGATPSVSPSAAVGLSLPL